MCKVFGFDDVCLSVASPRAATAVRWHSHGHAHRCVSHLHLVVGRQRQVLLARHGSLPSTAPGLLRALLRQLALLLFGSLLSHCTLLFIGHLFLCKHCLTSLTLGLVPFLFQHYGLLPPCLCQLSALCEFSHLLALDKLSSFSGCDSSCFQCSSTFLCLCLLARCQSSSFFLGCSFRSGLCLAFGFFSCLFGLCGLLGLGFCGGFPGGSRGTVSGRLGAALACQGVFTGYHSAMSHSVSALLSSTSQ